MFLFFRIARLYQMFNKKTKLFFCNTYVSNLCPYMNRIYSVNTLMFGSNYCVTKVSCLAGFRTCEANC